MTQAYGRAERKRSGPKGKTHCEWKGTASCFDAIAGQEVRPRAAWTYQGPNAAFAEGPFKGAAGTEGW